MSLSRQVVGRELDQVRRDEAMGFNRLFPDPAFGVFSYEATCSFRPGGKRPMAAHRGGIAKRGGFSWRINWLVQNDHAG
ncbi:MAG: hypothetical protein KA152_01595 [Verrucomicrobiales bacterium]|nr:hypothetical protein [Verrucomicrobiales bacterium]